MYWTISPTNSKVNSRETTAVNCGPPWIPKPKVTSPRSGLVTGPSSQTSVSGPSTSPCPFYDNNRTVKRLTLLKCTGNDTYLIILRTGRDAPFAIQRLLYKADWIKFLTYATQLSFESYEETVTVFRRLYSS